VTRTLLSFRPLLKNELISAHGQTQRVPQVFITSDTVHSDSKFKKNYLL